MLEEIGHFITHWTSAEIIGEAGTHHDTNLDHSDHAHNDSYNDSTYSSHHEFPVHHHGETLYSSGIPIPLAPTYEYENMDYYPFYDNNTDPYPPHFNTYPTTASEPTCTRTYTSHNNNDPTWSILIFVIVIILLILIIAAL